MFKIIHREDALYWEFSPIHRICICHN